MRKLASIQRITSIRPIEGANKIECATILGWEVIVAKEQFSVNQLCVYVEIDSIVPDRPEFEFLRSRKFKIKTIKLRGNISQGIAFPVSIIPGFVKVDKTRSNPNEYKVRIENGYLCEGDDVTEIIGVVKYDPEAAKEALEIARLNAIHRNRIDKFLKRYKWYRKYFTKSGKRGWPEFIKKTDEERIQNFPWICDKEKDTVFVCTEKVDGSSATFSLLKLPRRWWNFKPKYAFIVCSRNVHLKTEHPCSYWDIANKYNIKQVLSNLIGGGEFVILQGEIIGEGIQGNKYKLKGKDFYAFNLIFPDGGRCAYERMARFLSPYDIKCVPLLDLSFRLCDNIRQCVELAKGKSTICDIHREGIVIRNEYKSLSCKIINPEFLLKYQDEE